MYSVRNRSIASSMVMSLAAGLVVVVTHGRPRLPASTRRFRATAACYAVYGLVSGVGLVILNVAVHCPVGRRSAVKMTMLQGLSP
jgi:hypothetical protein